MPRKNYKNKIMWMLEQYHNPFRLTKTELEQADTLLTAMENDENWIESLQTLADMLEVLPLEIHENQEEYDAAVQRDAGLQHQPIHVSAASDRDNVLDALEKELEFQRTHALYRYMNDQLQRCSNEATELAFLAAYKDIADHVERTSTKESVTAVLDNYSRIHGAPNLDSVPQDLVRATEDKLISDFEKTGWILGYSGPDIVNITRAVNAFEKENGNRRVKKNTEAKYLWVKDALTKIHEMDAEFQENMKAFTALQSKNPKDAKLNALIEDVRETLNMKNDADGFSLNRVFMNKENFDLETVFNCLDDATHSLYYRWREKSDGKVPHLYGKEKKRFNTAEKLRETMVDIQDYLSELLDHDIDLRDFTVTNKWLPDYRLMKIGSTSEESLPDKFYQERLDRWHDEKMERRSDPAEEKESKKEQEKEEEQAKEQEKEQEKEKASEQEPEKEPEQEKPQVQPEENLVIPPTSGKEFYEGYENFIQKYGEAARKKINSNNIKELHELYNSNAMDAAGKDYLAHRMTELQKVNALEAVSVPGKAPQVQPTENGSIVLPAVQREPQNSSYGCWSVSLATQLQYRGADLDQKTIRAYRPDTEMADGKDVAYANKDTANYLENYAALVQDVLPDTALNNVTCEPMNKADDAEKCLRACVQRALVEDNAPLSIVFNGHYRTIIGIEKDPGGDASKDVLVFHDPSPTIENPCRATVQEFVDLCDRNLLKRNEDYQTDPDYQFAYQFSATWLQDLHMNEKGELGGEFRNMGISYENGALKCTNDNVGIGSDKVQAIFGEKLVPNMKNGVHIYLPKKSYSLRKAEREKAQQAEAERKALEVVADKGQDAVQQNVVEQTKAKAAKVSEATVVPKAAEASKVTEAPKIEKASEAEDISTSSKPQEKQNDERLSDKEIAARKVTEMYTIRLVDITNRLQKYMDILVETNTAAQWKKSAESYKKLYNTLRSMKGDEKDFFTALRKETPQKLREMLTDLDKARQDYLEESDRLVKKNPLVEEDRAGVADIMGKPLRLMIKQCDAAIESCQDFDVPAYINTLWENLEAKNAAKAKAPVKLTAKELADKVEKDSDDKVKETEVGTWTILELTNENKKSAVKKTGSAKTGSKKKSARI